jgi:hypothetical protein
LLIMVIAFTERLYSVLSYESIIHEVRPESASFLQTNAEILNLV